MGEIGSAKALPILQRLSNDPEAIVRMNAEEALERSSEVGFPRGFLKCLPKACARRLRLGAVVQILLVVTVQTLVILGILELLVRRQG